MVHSHHRHTHTHSGGRGRGLFAIGRILRCFRLRGDRRSRRRVAKSYLKGFSLMRDLVDRMSMTYDGMPCDRELHR